MHICLIDYVCVLRIVHCFVIASLRVATAYATAQCVQGGVSHPPCDITWVVQSKLHSILYYKERQQLKRKR